jgi:hypothetical protein
LLPQCTASIGALRVRRQAFGLGIPGAATFSFPVPGYLQGTPTSTIRPPSPAPQPLQQGAFIVFTPTVASLIRMLSMFALRS